VAALKRRLDQVAAEKHGAAEDQEFHALPPQYSGRQ
jgi:hypothetical protein